MALAGNALLLTYFVGQGEQSASLIQALGVGSNFVLLVQVIPPTPAYFFAELPILMKGRARSWLVLQTRAHASLGSLQPEL